MKHLFIVLSLISSLFSFDWPDDYQAALTQAKKEHKNVYVMVGFANCPYCTKMEEITFADQEVMKKLKKDYIYIYLSKDIDDIPKQFTIPFSPAHYFLEANGEVIYSTAGYKNKATFFKILKEVKAEQEL